jgi:DnaJ domain
MTRLRRHIVQKVGILVAPLTKALIWHPDKVEANKRPEAEEIFKNIKEAYEVLINGMRCVCSS